MSENSILLRCLYKVGDEAYPWPSSRRWIRHALKLVGPAKLLWGSDIPGLLTAGTYPQLVQQMDFHLSDLRKAERRAILGGNAIRAYPFRK